MIHPPSTRTSNPPRRSPSSTRVHNGPLRPFAGRDTPTNPEILPSNRVAWTVNLCVPDKDGVGGGEAA